MSGPKCSQHTLTASEQAAIRERARRDYEERCTRRERDRAAAQAHATALPAQRAGSESEIETATAASTSESPRHGQLSATSEGADRHTAVDAAVSGTGAQVSVSAEQAVQAMHAESGAIQSDRAMHAADSSVAGNGGVSGESRIVAQSSASRSAAALRGESSVTGVATVSAVPQAAAISSRAPQESTLAISIEAVEGMIDELKQGAETTRGLRAELDGLAGEALALDQAGEVGVGVHEALAERVRQLAVRAGVQAELDSRQKRAVSSLSSFFAAKGYSVHVLGGEDSSVVVEKGGFGLEWTVASDSDDAWSVESKPVAVATDGACASSRAIAPDSETQTELCQLAMAARGVLGEGSVGSSQGLTRHEEFPVTLPVVQVGDVEETESDRISRRNDGHSAL